MSKIKKLGWVGFNALQLLATLLWSVACITLALAVYAVTASQRLPLLMARRLWAPGLLKGAGARLEVCGSERIDWDKPVIVVANHQSVIDICALFAAVPVPLRFVLKRELKRLPFVGWYARAMGMVFIDRAGSRDAAADLRQARERATRGVTLAAFPEGTRSRSGALGRFKPGIFQVAIAAGTPVVPVAISGAGKVLPPGGFRVRPGRIRVVIGAPIAVDRMRPEDRGELARHTRGAIAALSANRALP